MRLIFFLIHLGLAGLIGYQGLMIFGPAPQEAPKTPIESNATRTPGTPAPPALTPQAPGKARGPAQAVIKRNLFKVLVDPPGTGKGQAAAQTRPAPEKTTLKLTLWGTVEGKSSSGSWAVIERKDKRRQDLYRVGDQIMGAKIIEISRNRVILNLEGKDQVLEAKTRPNPQRGGGGPKNLPAQFPLPELPAAQAQAVAKTPAVLLRSLRFRPYYQNGTPAGLLVYGIRPNSGLMAMGLKNGDIIRSVNDMELTSPKDLRTLADNLAPDQGMRIFLSRRGQEKEIFYKGVDE